MRTAMMSCALLLAMIGTGRAQRAPSAPGVDVPLAQVGDRTITSSEVDERWKADAPVEYAEAHQLLYDGRRAALDAIVADILLDRAARAAGLARPAYEGAEVARRMQPVSDADVAAFYAGNRSQMEGRSLQEMQPILREFLEDQHRTAARAALIAELKRSTPSLRDALDVPRQAVPVDAADPAQGPADAPVTVVEFADFQCPFCQRLAPALKQLRDHYGDRLRLVWKDAPLTKIHPMAFQAAQAGRCAQEQGRFWEYHDKLFANQQKLDAASLKQYARDAGLDAGRFGACLDSSKYRQRVQDAMSAAARLGISSTPTTYVNGRRIGGAKSYDVFAAVIDDELARATSGSRRDLP